MFLVNMFADVLIMLYNIMDPLEYKNTVRWWKLAISAGDRGAKKHDDLSSVC